MQKYDCNGQASVSAQDYNDCVASHNKAVAAAQEYKSLNQKCHTDCANELQKAKDGIIDVSAEANAAKRRSFIDGLAVGGLSGAALVILIMLLL